VWPGGAESRALAAGDFAPLQLPLGRQRISLHERNDATDDGLGKIVWRSVEAVTPAYRHTFDLRREE
jgi:hypothetical protein